MAATAATVISIGCYNGCYGCYKKPHERTTAATVIPAGCYNGWLLRNDKERVTAVTVSPTGCHSGCHEAPHKRPHQSFNVSEWTDSTGPRQTQKPSEPKGLHAGMIMASPGVLEPERVPCKSLLRIDFQITNPDRKPNGFNGRRDLFFQVQSAPLPP